MTDTHSPDMSENIFDEVYRLCSKSKVGFMSICADDYRLMCVGTKRNMIHVKNRDSDGFKTGFLRKTNRNEFELVTKSETTIISEVTVPK